MPQPYMALAVCQYFGTLGPLASECISWSPGIRFGRIKECNSYTTYIRSELIIYSSKLLLIYVTNSSPAGMRCRPPAWSHAWLPCYLPASLLACLVAGLVPWVPRCRPAAASSSSACIALTLDRRSSCSASPSGRPAPPAYPLSSPAPSTGPSSGSRPSPIPMH